MSGESKAIIFRAEDSTSLFAYMNLQHNVIPKLEISDFFKNIGR